MKSYERHDKKKYSRLPRKEKDKLTSKRHGKKTLEKEGDKAERRISFPNRAAEQWDALLNEIVFRRQTHR